MKMYTEMTRADYGPWRRRLDWAIYLGMALALGWAGATWAYNTESIPRLKANSIEWTEATADRFDEICRQHYGPEQFAPVQD